MIEECGCHDDDPNFYDPETDQYVHFRDIPSGTRYRMVNWEFVDATDGSQWIEMIRGKEAESIGGEAVS